MKRSIIRSLLASTVALLTFLVTAAAASAVDFFQIPPCPPAPTPGTCQPGGITTGPDGNLWFTEENGNRIGRITLGGAITEFTTANGLSSVANPTEITAGPDGRLWFSEPGVKKIGAITTAGAISEYPSSGTTTAAPDGITAGPPSDPQSLWFTEYDAGTGTSRIGRMTPAGVITDQFSLPVGTGPGDIAVGPDDRLWFTEGGTLTNKIGAIATNGTALQHYPPTGGLNDPSGITSSGGTLWFTESSPTASAVRRITTNGDIGPPTPVGSGPSAIATGVDGYLWFTETGAGKIGRLSPSGVLTNEFATSGPASEPSGITSGPDNALWFTENVGNNIGRIATATPGGGGGTTLPPAPLPAPVTSTKKKCKVPKLRGLTAKKARSKLRKAKCKYKFRGKGRVRSTKPKAGRTTTGRVTVKFARKKARR